MNDFTTDNLNVCVYVNMHKRVLNNNPALHVITIKCNNLTSRPTDIHFSNNF